MDLGTAFAVACARMPDAVAIVDGAVRRSYGDWAEEVARVAGGLARLGLKRGDHFVAVMANRYETATLYWACQALGAIFTPFNWRSGADDVAYVLNDAEARLVAFDDGAAGAVRAAVSQLGIDASRLVAVGCAGGTPFAALAEAPPVAGPAGADERDICLMLYTSGTTGRPKGVPRSHRAERTAAAACLAQLRYRFGEVQLGVMPLFHTMGQRIMLASVMLSGKLVCMQGFDAGAALELIAAEKITAMFLVPTMFHDMLQHPRFAATDIGSVRNIAYAGMSMTTTLERRCREAFRPEVFANYYGSSEIFTFAVCDHLDQKPGCAGRAGINQQIRVVRADAAGGARPDDVVPAGAVGEVIASMASPEAFSGYWKRPDADARAIRDGWYFTGDLGRMDEDGELFLCGRIDDMIISGGENIHPEEVEDTLAACPLVRQAAVIGVPDERWGQKVVAFIEAAAPDACAAALDTHCRSSSLARFKRPRAYVFVEQLPKSASGKLLRRLLREGQYAASPDHDTTL
jgi:2-furoate---CoA ligase